MTEQAPLKTNHNIRIVNLTTGANVLCLFGDVRNEQEENRVVGYRMLYPFTLTLGDPNDDGTIPIQYSRFCPFSPIEEHRLGGEHIISVVYPDNGILDNYVTKLKEFGLEDGQIFFEEETDGDNSESTEAGE
ncbi:hypothetical protein BOW91_gp097 [Synechococcus phage S-WAM2]|uniref:Uncharacterized protein n=1 Tax=Synechococcus phage S-WAM2 TaxID=1815522 RepID=A0A1D8KT99_9CAUD|nr:hypothetical protein BOW91_gp097 [Synechococcus phage S-WAM2]AOV61849.1 hypothetical protein P29B0810_154 [Synechococcus phage S-WAM2]